MVEKINAPETGQDGGLGIFCNEEGREGAPASTY
jgi:hypothetical protein